MMTAISMKLRNEEMFVLSLSKPTWPLCAAAFCRMPMKKYATHSTMNPRSMVSVKFSRSKSASICWIFCWNIRSAEERSAVNTTRTGIARSKPRSSLLTIWFFFLFCSVSWDWLIPARYFQGSVIVFIIVTSICLTYSRMENELQLPDL